MSGTSREEPVRDGGPREREHHTYERDEHAYEDAWYRALKAKAEQRTDERREENAEPPAPPASPAENTPAD
jgi:hypothetical protein